MDDLLAWIYPNRIAIAIATIAIALPLGWYLGSPLIIRTELDEPPPVVLDAAGRALASTHVWLFGRIRVSAGVHPALGDTRPCAIAVEPPWPFCGCGRVPLRARHSPPRRNRAR